MPNYIGAIDQGTTSTRFIIFDEEGRLVTSYQRNFEQIYPRPGWIEHDPRELISCTKKCMVEAMRKFEWMGHKAHHLKAIGITNQRETTILWDKETGEPLYNAIVWGDTRTNKMVKKLHNKEGRQEVEKKCGLPIHNYFAAVKLAWLIKYRKDVKKAIDDKRALFGTVDSWLIWNLTGGINGGVHVTDVTNASRTMLMNIHTCKWDPELLEFFGLPESILPKIVSSAEHYGDMKIEGSLNGIPITGCLGDQQAALVGQRCFTGGEAKNTYGTGAFLLLNIGTKPAISKHGLLTSIGYQLGKDQPVHYVMEGSISVAGSAIEWLKTNMGVIGDPREMDTLASKVQDTGGVMFVTAFSGLFAPYWRDDARGTIVGLTQYTTKHHLARATLESVCLSVGSILEAMKNEGHVPLKVLKADGGMSKSDTCMQIQADVLGIPVERPAMSETTGLGAAFAAGIGVGMWKDLEAIKKLAVEGADRFEPSMSEKDRKLKSYQWEEAIKRSFGWTDVYHEDDDEE
ncbi:uncharacterized protein BYT42DRAFT_14210 [Radiomyces spectabilis]|uniref:uncharacterized protein n=1 Tax=Radiomyces spectabilis TaxID=64574 RepID=UPI0022210FDD|nr:uncharacterized protein BYT42DRAFT_14210 [Radiomyces spectabilis]KAI8393648.1 hypothetical protein BYT42DRAFT_14210 [Radiomyces spectabilis]